jgi:hypothetical protein
MQNEECRTPPRKQKWGPETAQRHPKPSQSHIKASLKPGACGGIAGRMRDVLVFCSYSPRVLLVFSSYFDPVIPGGLQEHAGGSSESQSGFDGIGGAGIRRFCRRDDLSVGAGTK